MNIGMSQLNQVCLSNNIGSSEYNNWYAAFVTTGDEDNVKARLDYKFSNKIEVFVPKRILRERKNGNWHNVIRPMFPGYILIKGKIDLADFCEYKNIPNLLKLLHDENEILSIPEHEIDAISNLMNNGEIIGPSNVLEAGRNVQIIDGPLCGMEANILSINRRKGRAKVKIPFLGQDKIVELSIKIVDEKH